MFRDITVDSANTRSWSNEFLDLFEGTVLLVHEYETRLEAVEFRRRRTQVAEGLAPAAAVLGALRTRLVDRMLTRGFGRHRQGSSRASVALVSDVMPIGVSVLTAWWKAENSVITEWVTDPHLRAWGRRVPKMMAAIPKPTVSSFRFPFRGALVLGAAAWAFCWACVRPRMAAQYSDSFVTGLRYVRGIVDLCWEAGLRTGPAPLILMMEDLSRFHERANQRQRRELDPDALFGPIFPRAIALQAEAVGDDGGMVQQREVPEWLLLMMSPDEMRVELGKGLHKDVKCHLTGAWGYEPGPRWVADDFHMAFDRIYRAKGHWGKTLHQLADRYHTSYETAQERTNALLKRLHIDPPRGPRSR